MIIQDATTGNAASVNEDGQVAVEAEQQPFQHYNSLNRQLTFQAPYFGATITTGTEDLIHMANNNSSFVMAITFIRVQVITDATVPASTEYIQLGFGQEYASGGTAVTPVNVNVGNGNTSGVTAYGNNPTVSGTFTEIDRWYLESNGKEQVYNKAGAVIVSNGQAFGIKLVGTGSGVANVRVSYAMVPNP
jgi:hypothetical protein